MPAVSSGESRRWQGESPAAQAKARAAVNHLFLHRQIFRRQLPVQTLPESGEDSRGGQKNQPKLKGLEKLPWLLRTVLERRTLP
jgi:hypothetical protein